jgi:hypothetical protein
MKAFIVPSYTFTPGASGVGTVNLSGITSFDIKKLVSIINQTRGVIIYATASSTYKYTGVAGSTVTLFVDTSTHDANDKLQVIYEDDTIESRVGAFVMDEATMNAYLHEYANDSRRSLLMSEYGQVYVRDITVNESINGQFGSLLAKIPASRGAKASADSLATVLSSEQEAILTAIRDGVRASTPNGSSQSNSTVGTSATSVAIPANTVGFIIQGHSGNTGLYWSLGATAANDGTSGHKLEDSRDTGFIPYAGTGNLSLIGDAAAQRYQITWFTRS